MARGSLPHLRCTALRQGTCFRLSVPGESVNAQCKEAQWRTNYLATNRRLASQTNAERFRRYGRKCSLIPLANQTGPGRDTKSFASQRSVEGILRETKLPRTLWQTIWHQLLCKTAIHRPCRCPARTSIAPPASKHMRASNLSWRSSTEKIVRQPRCQSRDENHQHHHDCFSQHEPPHVPIGLGVGGLGDARRHEHGDCDCNNQTYNAVGDSDDMVLLDRLGVWRKAGRREEQCRDRPPRNPCRTRVRESAVREFHPRNAQLARPEQ
jgi:hypothetical protein